MRIQYNRTKLYSLLDIVSKYDNNAVLPAFDKEVDRTINKKKSMLWERNVNKECKTGFDGLGFEGSLKRADIKWGNQIKDEITLIKSLLNKISINNFNKISDRICNINSSFLLKNVIDLIYEKAINEPQFSEMYANLSLKLINKNLEFIKIVKCNNKFYWINDSFLKYYYGPFDNVSEYLNNTDNKVEYQTDFTLKEYKIIDKQMIIIYTKDNKYFVSIVNEYIGPFNTYRLALTNSKDTFNVKKQFLSLCQLNFQYNVETDVININKEIQINKEDPIKLFDLEEQIIKIRDRRKGVLVFIGSLYNKNIVKESILNSCIISSLNRCNDYGIEDACNILKIIQPVLIQLSNYSKLLNNVYNLDNISSRIKFMIQDIFDLYNNKDLYTKPDVTIIEDSNELNRKVVNMIIEYYNNKDNDEMINCFLELKHRNIIVEKMIDYAINYEKYIDTIKNIINILSDRKLLSSNDIQSGLDNILEFIDDIIIDSPNAKLTINTLFKK